MTRPQRRYKVTITIQGDTWEDAMRELRGIARHVEDHGPECQQVSGGYSTGSIVDVEFDPEMTGDKYRDLITDQSEDED